MKLATSNEKWMKCRQAKHTENTEFVEPSFKLY